MRWGRIVVAGLIGELIPIILLVAVVAVFGPRELGAAQAFAEKTGHWFGPLAGVLVSFLAALWVARRLEHGQVAHGIAVGVLIALIDDIILVAMKAPFEWVFVASNLGKIIAGAAGGFVAKSRASAAL
jgi:hypothetical protein